MKDLDLQYLSQLLLLLQVLLLLLLNHQMLVDEGAVVADHLTWYGTL